MPGTLWIVATPIGNLQDFTERARVMLRSVPWIACEDTRVTRVLLEHIGAHQATMTSLHHHSSPVAIRRVLEHLRQGEDVAYVTDAGTPGMNDPGGVLVAHAYAEGMNVSPIPGPSAIAAAISVCGFPMERFRYIGFLPHKKGKQSVLREIATDAEPTIFLESTHRILKTLQALREVLEPARNVFCGRELTKLHETLYRGTLDHVCDALQATSVKGEFICIIGPSGT